ncbi:MAG: GntR family transcriptional regulator [Candidatus Nanopelagicales bacterium]|nr:GntR family transcriptional regulator [Candidatus Nanopelagicales bacterium]MDP4907141.1 GntR family transcriptional regulator [Candidatus Nanopelagicales bacterium]MDP4907950.1 GntR family transcriptional regulator [Candidatus Nanopelagicales bacterium]
MSALQLVQPDLTGGESQSDHAYRDIRALIVTLELAPGSLLSEPDLQQRLGLGRTPIREALRTLAHERLVDVYPRRGMFVAALDPRDLAALSEVREQLEPYAARLAAQRRTVEDLEVIDDLLAAIDTNAHDPDMRILIELDQRIHHHVYRCAHNDFLQGVCIEHYMHALRIWFLALDRVSHLGDAVAEHRDLLVAIREGDADRAAQVMSSHVTGFEAEVRRAI